MRPFLLVGCGGSGGVTLQFLLDQLAADLSLRGVHKVPDAWQFLHVDVPVSPDGVRAGLPPVVTAHANGTYAGLAPAAGSYASVSNALVQQLLAADRYGQLATWFSNPAKVPVPISEGAGQRREVGRVVTLARLRQVRDGLTAALTKLNAPGVREELRALARQVSPGTEAMVDSPPLVVVVSSMAGGAGASMVLDVCRVLSQQTAVDPASTALFLYTPEVFQSLPDDARQGIPGNALAMTGELLATQLGASAADDVAIFEAVGLGQGRAGRATPFGRVFPIGAKLGASGTSFADGKIDQIYRGIGRGLAALMLSGEATQRWVGFDLTNGGALDSDRADFGWSANKNDLQWGSFGFSQLNMGRDRYAEYAAQRLARKGVLQLVQGHLQQGDPGTAQEQRDRLVTERLPAFSAALGLPAPGQGLEDWFNASFVNPAWGSGQALVERHIERELTAGVGGQLQQWLANVQNAVQYLSARLNDDAAAEGYRHVYSWYERTLPAVEATVEHAVTTYGLPATLEMLSRVEAGLGAIAAGMVDGASGMRRDASAVHPDVFARASAAGGTVDPRSGPVQLVREGYTDSCYRAVLGHAAAKLAEVLGAMRNELLAPLREALGDSARTLEVAVSAPVKGGALVQLRTDEFSQWPVEGQPVPARFTHAQNEVLLIDAGLFAEQFDQHVLRTMSLAERPVGSAPDALDLAAREVVLAQWPTTGAPVAERLLEQRVRWRPSALSTEPGSNEPVATRRGQYRLAVDPREVLDRARQWTGRVTYPFEQFVSTALRDYVGAEELGESVRSERLEEVARKFREALQLAHPLVAVNPELVSQLHGGQQARVAYKFSEVPFKGLALSDDLKRFLDAPGTHPSSVDFLDSALRSSSSATRIDVFGSYPPLAPLAFTSLLSPLAGGWAEANLPAARESFYSGRRSRRLAGALPMNERQRRAIVAGWFVARLTGRLRLPGEVPGVQAVQVWDDVDGGWLSFPNPLIVPALELSRTPNNYLPAVMLSYLLAAAQSTANESLRPLRPYTLLRQHWDSSTEGVDLAVDDNPALLTATQRFQEFFTSGRIPEGAPPAYAKPPTGDLATDKKTVVDRLVLVRDTVAADYLPPVEGAAQTTGRFSRLQRADDLWSIPLFHEVAPDVHWATSQLIRVVQDGVGAAATDVLI
ncbi:MAG: hypothetical protein JWO60_1407 [Frankiales bacterium]|nr:hypothetical protein [Frankiales bacterium]